MEKLYIVCYDISDDRRWRHVYRTMKEYGAWLQLSVFQCRLDKIGVLKLEDDLRNIIDHKEDHVIIMDLGNADNVSVKISSIGKGFEPIERKPVIV